MTSRRNPEAQKNPPGPASPRGESRNPGALFNLTLVGNVWEHVPDQRPKSSARQHIHGLESRPDD